MVKKCPDCGGKVEQMISAPAVQFKGSGWYVTDYAKRPGSSSGSDSDSSESGGKSESSKGPAETAESKGNKEGKDGKGAKEKKTKAESAAKKSDTK